MDDKEFYIYQLIEKDYFTHPGDNRWNNVLLGYCTASSISEAGNDVLEYVADEYAMTRWQGNIYVPFWCSGSRIIVKFSPKEF